MNGRWAPHHQKVSIAYMGYFPPPASWAPPQAWQHYYADVQRRGIRRLANIHGAGLLLAGVLQVALIGPLLALPEFFPALENDPLWANLIQMAVTVLTLCPAALLSLRLLNPHEHNRALPFGRPFAAAPDGSRARLNATVLCLGLLACFAGSLLSSMAEMTSNSLGFTLQLPDDQAAAPSGPAMLALRLMVTALGPAVIEELLMRGAILQPLRRYGDAFAIIVSSLLFALLHGNALQGIFAFFAGLGMGYAVVLSGSLWPGIIIHFVNNALSVVLGEVFLRYAENERVLTVVNLSYYAFHVLVGAAGLMLALLWRRERPKLWRPRPALLSEGVLSLNYLFCSVPMVLSLLVFCIEIFRLAILSNTTT